MSNIEMIIQHIVGIIEGSGIVSVVGGIVICVVVVKLILGDSAGILVL